MIKVMSERILQEKLVNALQSTPVTALLVFNSAKTGSRLSHEIDLQQILTILIKKFLLLNISSIIV